MREVGEEEEGRGSREHTCVLCHPKDSASKKAIIRCTPFDLGSERWAISVKIQLVLC